VLWLWLGVVGVWLLRWVVGCVLWCGGRVVGCGWSLCGWLAGWLGGGCAVGACGVWPTPSGRVELQPSDLSPGRWGDADGFLILFQSRIFPI
jgi:hypothetical protein